MHLLNIILVANHPVQLCQLLSNFNEAFWWLHKCLPCPTILMCWPHLMLNMFFEYEESPKWKWKWKCWWWLEPHLYLVNPLVSFKVSLIMKLHITSMLNLTLWMVIFMITIIWLHNWIQPIIYIILS